MSVYQQKYGTNFSSYDAFEQKLFKNTFVAFIMKHPVERPRKSKIELEIPRQNDIEGETPRRHK